MNSTVISAEDLKTRLHGHLQDDLAAVNQILDRHLEASGRFVQDVTGHVSRFRGKQIRPVLLLLFQRLTADKTTREAHMLAAAVEMIHTATLVHDDIIDDAETRRHVATIHRRWNVETGVLFGDYLFSKSFHLAASTGDAEACRLIGVATDRTCEGELNQIAVRTDRSTSETDYFRVIRDKTGQLFRLSCLLGARSAGADSSQCRAAGRFGMRLGTAFQIADDILDLTAARETTGKDSGNDLQNGRLTLPLIRAVQFCDSEAERLALREILSDVETSRTAALCEHSCVQSGIQSAADTAAELVSRAVKDLAAFPDNESRALLEQIAEFSVHRRN